MVTVTFIRHGQSEDNCRDVWAGWKDAPLSALGKRQAKALGGSLSSTRFTHIYASDLLRAHDTGRAVHSQLAEPTPFTVTKLVREQHFGDAEGNKWTIDIPPGATREELYKKGIYPVIPGRSGKFSGGESLDDLHERAKDAIKECLYPHLENEDGHIAIASHGLCIAEMMSALVKMDPHADHSVSYRGLLNTAWTRVEVRRRAGQAEALEVKISHVNHAKHLDNLPLEDFASPKPEGSPEARAFFGGAAPSITNADVKVSPKCEK